MVHRLLIVALSCLVTSLAVGATQPERDAPAREDQREIPWPAMLGLRVMQVEQAFPLIDRVVLVPDEATYIDELSRWSPDGRWPVLIEDDVLAPMFIRRFEPAEVIRRDSVGEADATREILENIVVSAWGGEPGRQSIRESFAAHGYTPPGVVVTSHRDPARTAAVALAAGRGQPLIWIDQRYGHPDALIQPAAAAEFAAHIEEGLKQIGYSYHRLGDEIDAITICRDMGGRVELPTPPLPPEIAGSDRHGETEPAAMTDYLGRRGGKTRYAIVGWIFGDETRSAYMAMCSLFLPRVNVMMYDTYPDEEGWSHYDMNGAAAVLSERGCEVSLFNRRRTTETSWLGMIADGLTTDVFIMNSRGNPREFELYGDDKGSPLDVPLLNTPVALHLTHSWSLRSPNSLGTVGGRWLSRGVYAYVGSSHEPYLSAFLPPMVLVQRWMSGVPFLVGARYWLDRPQPFSGPWKVNTIGDPLMLFAPPHEYNRERTSPDELPARDGVDLIDRVEALLVHLREAPSGELYAEAIALLDLLGRDEIALPLWRMAEAAGDEHAQPAARPALGPLFRARDVDGFVRAWNLIDRRDDRAVDMLWHLLTPRLESIRDEETLLHLQSSVRRDYPHIDLGRLGPHLARAFSSTHVRSVIEREIERMDSEREKRQLQRLLQQY